MNSYSRTLSNIKMADSYPRYSTCGLLISDRDATLTIMYRYTRFIIRLNVKDLSSAQANCSASSFEQKFQHYRETIDDEPGVMEEFEEWMVEPCLEYIRSLSPDTPPAVQVSLWQFYNTDSHTLQVRNANGNLQANLLPESPTKDTSIPKFVASGTLTQEVETEQIDFVLASNLEVLRAVDPDEYELSETPRIVQHS